MNYLYKPQEVFVYAADPNPYIANGVKYEYPYFSHLTRQLSSWNTSDQPVNINAQVKLIDKNGEHTIKPIDFQLTIGSNYEASILHTIMKFQQTLVAKPQLSKLPVGFGKDMGTLLAEYEKIDFA